MIAPILDSATKFVHAIEVTGGDLNIPIKLAVSGLVGLAVGLEREWSGPADGPNIRFAGLRTFTLLGLLGGIAGILLTGPSELGGMILLAAGGGISISAYIGKILRKETTLDATTEVAAIVVLALGTLAVVGGIQLALALAAIVVLLLGEKARLHWLVHRISETELTAALRFAVMALVILPLLPSGPFGGILDIRPRSLWSVVLLFSGLNFLGYVARQILGADRGYTTTGLLGGLVSSTAVTLNFARQSRSEPTHARALACGVIGACTVLLPRILVLSAILNLDVAIQLLPLFVFPALLGFTLLFLYSRSTATRASSASRTSAAEHDNQSPLGLLASVRMAIAFQIAMSGIAVVRRMWGTTGVYASAAALGSTDVDALTLSITRAGTGAHVAAQAIIIGIVANTILKTGIGTIFGESRFRRIVAPALLILAVTMSLTLWLVWR